MIFSHANFNVENLKKKKSRRVDIRIVGVKCWEGEN